METLKATIGEDRLAIRLALFILYNEERERIKGRKMGPFMPRTRIRDEPKLCSFYRA